METLDKTGRPESCRAELLQRYPRCRQAFLKTGGDFPFLSRSDDVNLHVEVHLRAAGVTVNLPQLGAGGSPG